MMAKVKASKDTSDNFSLYWNNGGTPSNTIFNDPKHDDTVQLLIGTDSYDGSESYANIVETKLHPSVIIPKTPTITTTLSSNDSRSCTKTASPPQSSTKRRPPGRVLTPKDTQQRQSKCHPSLNIQIPTLEEYFGSVKHRNDVADPTSQTPSTMVSTIASLSSAGMSMLTPPIVTKGLRDSMSSIPTIIDSMSDFGTTIHSTTTWKRDATDETDRKLIVAIRLKALHESTIRGWNIEKSDEEGDNGVYVIQQSRSMRRRILCSSTLSRNHPTYAFDNLYDEGSTTAEVYESLGKPIIEAVGTGYTQNGTIFAYGATGSGKTYTMQGSADQPGFIQLAANNLFSVLEQEKSGGKFSTFHVSVQYIEIYNEQVRDLLDNLRSLVIQEDVSGNVVFDAVEEEVRCPEDVIRLLDDGNTNRACASTQQNSHSSRSHALFRLCIQMKSSNGAIQNNFGSPSVLTLIDLAGSENSMRAFSTGTRKHEGGMINQSLLTLSQVIQSLSLPEHKRPKHISYRSSKLTRLLKPQLTGNSSIALLSCVSAELSKLDETKSTLVFATTAKKIVVSPSLNESSHTISGTESVTNELQKELSEARQSLQELQDRFDESLRIAILQATLNNVPVIAVESSNRVAQSFDYNELVEEEESNDASSDAAIGDTMEDSNKNATSTGSKAMMQRRCSSSFESDYDTPPVSVVMVDAGSPLANPLEDVKVKQLIENADVKMKFLEQQLAAAEVLVDGVYQSIRDLQLKHTQELSEQQKLGEKACLEMQLKHSIELEQAKELANITIRSLQLKHADELEQLHKQSQIKTEDIPMLEDFDFIVQQGYVIAFFCLFSTFLLLNGRIETFAGVVMFLWIGREISVSCL